MHFVCLVEGIFQQWFNLDTKTDPRMPAGDLQSLVSRFEQVQLGKETVNSKNKSKGAAWPHAWPRDTSILKVSFVVCRSLSMCFEESGKSHPSFACRDKLSRTRFHDSLLSIPSRWLPRKGILRCSVRRLPVSSQDLPCWVGIVLVSEERYWQSNRTPFSLLL